MSYGIKFLKIYENRFKVIKCSYIDFVLNLYICRLNIETKQMSVIKFCINNYDNAENTSG